MKRLLCFCLVWGMALALFPALPASASGLDGWNVDGSGVVDTEVVVDTSEFHTGSSSLKITRSTPKKSNVYTEIYQYLPVEKGKTYRYGVWVKAKGSVKDSVSLIVDWGARANLSPVESTFDWTWYDFSYTHLTDAKNVILRFVVNSPCQALWIDDAEFVEVSSDAASQENMLKNPGFEGSNAAAVPEDTENVVEPFNTLISESDFTAQEFYDVLAGSKVIPVYHAQDIAIDADLSEWASSPAVKLPTLANQKTQWLLQDVDATMTLKFMYDEKYLYVSAYVEDNVYYPIEGSQYWAGDGLQMCLGDIDGSYGAEIGIGYLEKSGISKYSTDYGESQMEDLQVDVKVSPLENGKNAIVYEMGIPWALRWGEFQEEVPFSILYNENDGLGRISAIQLSPGISESKSNVEFPTLKMVPQGNEFFAWSDPLVRTFMNTDAPYGVYVMNTSSADQEFTIRVDELSYEDKLTVPAGSVRKFTGMTQLDKSGTQSLDVLVSCGEQQEMVTCTFDVKTDPDFYVNSVATVKAKADEISALIDQCYERGLTTDYEDVAEFLLTRFQEYIQTDITVGNMSRVDNNMEELDRIYNIAKADLEAYLAGTKTPKAVPRYRTSEMDIDGLVLTADAELNGKTERRPTYFVGYGHFNQAKMDIPIFNSVGANIIQFDLGPRSFVNLPSSAPGFTLGGTYNVQSEMVEDKSGEWPNKYLKVSCSDPATANVFSRLSQKVVVEPYTTYEYGFRIKATDAETFWTGMEEWPDERHEISGTFDWKEFSFEYTTGGDHELLENETLFNIVFERPATEILIDDMWVRKKGTTENLLFNGDLEARTIVENGKMIIDASEQVAAAFESAEKNNVAVNFLLSAHYFPTGLLNETESALPGQMVYLNPKSERVKEIISDYLKVILPKIGKYKSLNSICILNEPVFASLQAPEYWQEDFVAYLTTLYEGDINQLNEVYGSDYTSFDEVQMPKDLDTTPLFHDWKQFNDELTHEWVSWYTQEVKKYLPDVPVHSKIMQPIYANDSALRLHILYGLEPELYAEVSDLNGNDAYNYYNSSSRDALEKFMWYDLQTSLKLMPVVNSEDHIFADGAVLYHPNIALHGGTDIWQGALHGRGQTTIWMWEHEYLESVLSNSVLTRPDAIYEIARASLDLNRLAYEMTALETREGQIGIIASELTRVYQTSYANNLYSAYTAAMFNGQAVGFVSDTQMKNIHRYPIVFAPNITNTYPEALDELIRYIDGGGKLVLLGEDCFGRDERNLPLDEEKVNYIRTHATVIPTENDDYYLVSPTGEELQAIMAEMLDEKNMRRVRIVDAETGEDVRDIEFRYADYNDSLLINLCNFKWGNDISVKILVDGKEVESCTELRSGEVYGSTFQPQPYVPILLQIDGDKQVMEEGIRLQIGNPVMTIDGARTVVDPGNYDVTPQIVDGRTLLPVRKIVESLGGTVEWEEQTQKVTITKGSDVIVLTLGDKTAYVNGEARLLDTAPETIQERTMLPIRFIAENLGLDVEWREKAQMVILRD